MGAVVKHSLAQEVDVVENAEEKHSQVFLASIAERYCFNPTSEKKTFHVALDLGDSKCTYAVGDCIGIYPQNDSDLVDKILKLLKLSGEECVTSKNKSISFRHFLQNLANLNRISPNLGGRDFFNFLKSCTLTPQEITDQLLPMMPRFYSVASSISVLPKEVHLTVALTQNEPDCTSPYGTCSYFLCCKAPMNTACIPIFHKSAKHFSLPSDSFDKPLIMIGPGTGVAPFRGFMQERLYRNASRENWLFFGERHNQTDFYYKDFWESLQAKNFLKLSTAFSRDQLEKIYVQHRMLENSKEIWEWLEKGAYLYVCGDAKNMAKSVDKTLLAILEKEGNLDPIRSKEYVRSLKKQNRYQRDVY